MNRIFGVLLSLSFFAPLTAHAMDDDYPAASIDRQRTHPPSTSYEGWVEEAHKFLGAIKAGQSKEARDSFGILFEEHSDSDEASEWTSHFGTALREKFSELEVLLEKARRGLPSAITSSSSSSATQPSETYNPNE